MKEHLIDYLNQSKTKYVRGIRILLEYFYATEIFESITQSKTKIVSVFGSARTHPDATEFRDAKKLGFELYKKGFAVVTGASKGIMHAANEGVAQAILQELKSQKTFKNVPLSKIKKSQVFQKRLKKFSVGLRITLPHETIHNPFVGVYATFHYFMVRKFFFGTLSSAFVACEGGWGTRDELFEILTLVQTGKSSLLPVIYISKDAKHLTDDLKYCLRKKYISPEDMNLIDVVKTHQQAAKIIDTFYKNIKSIQYFKFSEIEIMLSRSFHKKSIELLDKKLKPFSKFYKKISISSKKVFIKGFDAPSYGILRKIVDKINSVNV